MSGSRVGIGIGLGLLGGASLKADLPVDPGGEPFDFETAMIPSPLHWWSASYPASITESPAGKIAAVADKGSGGISVTQSALDRKPNYPIADAPSAQTMWRHETGSTSLRDFLAHTSATAAVAQPFTFYTFFKPETLTGTGTIIKMLNGGGQGPWIRWQNTSGYKMAMNAGVDQPALGDIIIGEGQYVSAGFVFDGASSKYAINDNTIGTVNAGPWSMEYFDVDIGASGGGSQHMMGLMGDILIYTGAHSDAQLTSMVVAMNRKYNEQAF